MTDLDLDHIETPAGYAEWTAQAKAEWLWDVLILGSAHAPSQLPPLRLPFKSRPLTELGIVVRKRELRKALERESDLMEPGRPKVIHARGAVAQVRLDTEMSSPFSGLLAAPPAGGARGLLRMSMVAKVAGKAAVTPALALKLLVDGHPSADVLAMNHTVGQGRDFDMFANSMTNDLTLEHKELRTPQKMMSVLFDRVSEQPRRLVSDHLATRSADGAQAEHPEAPDRLVFHPTPEARQVFAGQAGVDFRLVLASIRAGTRLYSIDGVRNDETIHVGALVTTSEFVSSDGGDRLFFRHVQDPADIKPT